MSWQLVLSRSSSAMTSTTLPINLSPDTRDGANPPTISLINQPWLGGMNRFNLEAAHTPIWRRSAGSLKSII